MSNSVFVKKLHPLAKMAKATEGSAAYDLCYCETGSVVLRPGMTHAFETGLALEMDSSKVALVCSRSGLALKYGVSVLNAPGIVDSDFRGEIKVILHNVSKNNFFVNPGDRIAQLMFQDVPAVQIAFKDELGETDRGEGGFGSTGIK